MGQGEELEMELRLELNCKKSKGKPNISKSSTESHEVGQQRGRVARVEGSVRGSRGACRGRKRREERGKRALGLH